MSNSFDKSFAELAERLSDDACDKATRDEAIAAIKEIIADRNDEYRRAEEWRENFAKCNARLDAREHALRVKDAKTIKKLRLKLAEQWRLDTEYSKLSQHYAQKDMSFEFHIKQLAEANLQLERRNDELQIEVLDCLLEMHLRGLA